MAEFLTKHEAIESGDGSGSDDGSGSGNAENVEEGSAWVVDACPAMPTPKPPKGKDYAVRFAWESSFLMCTKDVCLRHDEYHSLSPIRTLGKLRNLFQGPHEHGY